MTSKWNCNHAWLEQEAYLKTESALNITEFMMNRQNMVKSERLDNTENCQTMCISLTIEKDTYSARFWQINIKIGNIPNAYCLHERNRCVIYYIPLARNQNYKSSEDWQMSKVLQVIVMLEHLRLFEM